MAVRTITTKLALDGETQFKQAVTSINGAMRNLKSEIALSEAQFKGQANTVAALTAKNNLLAASIDQQKEKIKTLNDILKRSAEIYGEESSITDKYRQQLNRAQAELIGLDRELVNNSKYLKEARDSADKTAKSIDGFGNATKKTGNAVNQLAGVLQAAGVAATLHEIAGAIQASVDASKKFETAMANFNKAAKLPDDELRDMAAAIKELSTEIPATTSEIAQVAEASSRLGIAKDNVLEFSRVMIDLGNVSDLSSDQAATALARFANITGTAAEDYERLGSTVVALGNNFATSESEITNMSSRLAAAGELANLSEADIMGLAAAMASVGIEAEAGGTAMTQTLTAMEKAVTSGGEKLEQFAQIAGMSSQAFSSAWSEDPITAIQAFISGLAGLDEKGESATQVLEDLGLSGIRQANMLKSLALANETLVSAVATANQAWIENTELAETAAAKYDTTQAKLDMAANAANNLKIAVGDQLAPALGTLADAGTGAFSWAADFVSEQPILVSAITGVVAAGGVLATGFTVYAAKAALATIATTSFGAALAATPIGPIAVGIGALVGAFTAVTSAASEAKDANEEFRESLEAIKEATAENSAAAAESAETLRGMADAVILLADSAELTEVQYQALQEMIQQLNASVPGLNLAYDEQTGKLNLTAEAVRNLTAAEGDRLVNQEAAKAYNDLLTQQMVIAQQLTAAEVDLEKARAANSAAAQETIKNGEHVIQLDRDLAAAQSEAAEKVGELRQKFNDLQSAIDDLEAEYGDLSAANDTFIDATDKTGSAVSSAEDSIEDLTAAVEELEDATLYLTGAADTLSDALKEQSEAGTLSYETAQKLIDAGYGAALAIDEESGALRLNRELYIQITQAKIDEQIATLEAAAASNQAAIAAQDEAMNVAGTAEAYFRAAEAKRELEGQQVSYSAQIAALNALKSSIGSVTGEAQRAARTSRSASRQAKTQAQQDLETYKQLKAELDHQKNTDLVDEAEYYRKMAEYRDAYLTDSSNVSEYRKVTEQIYKYDKSLADQEAQLWADQTDELVSQLEERVKAVTGQQDKMEDRLSGYGDLFEVKDNDLTLNSIQEQIDAIDAYEDALTRLKERNISGGLMDEVLNMDVDSATQYANELLSMSEAQWEQYNALWDEKQKRAIEVAEQFFKDQMNALENEYNDKLGNALDTMTDTSFASGENTGQGLIDGLASKEQALYTQAQKMADQVSKILAGAGRIPSNSELAASFSTDRIRERYQGVTPQQLQDVGVGMVNAMSAAGTAGAAQPLNITIQTEDKLTIARAFVPDIRAASKESPEVLDDK